VRYYLLHLLRIRRRSEEELFECFEICRQARRIHVFPTRFLRFLGKHSRIKDIRSQTNERSLPRQRHTPRLRKRTTNPPLLARLTPSDLPMVARSPSNPTRSVQAASAALPRMPRASSRRSHLQVRPHSSLRLESTTRTADACGHPCSRLLSVALVASKRAWQASALGGLYVFIVYAIRGWGVDLAYTILTSPRLGVLVDFDLVACHLLHSVLLLDFPCLFSFFLC